MTESAGRDSHDWALYRYSGPRSPPAAITDCHRWGCSVIGTMNLSGIATRRMFALLLAVAVLLVPVALPQANAEPNYPPSFYKISADSFSTRVGGKIEFKAQTFQSGSTVNFDVAADGTTVTSGSTDADRKGVARETITFRVVGTNTLTVTGTSDKGQPLTLTADVEVTAAGDGDDNGNSNGNGNDPGTNDDADESGGVPFFGGGLPRTGGEIALTVLIGLALLGGGAALVAATRRRRTS
jgi:hypothetical protein